MGGMDDLASRLEDLSEVLGATEVPMGPVLAKHWDRARRRGVVNPSADPVPHMLRFLAHRPVWRALVRSPELADFVARTVVALAWTTTGAPRRLCDRLSVTARRHVVAAVRDDRYLGPENLRRDVMRLGLPRPVVRSDGEGNPIPISWEKWRRSTRREFLRHSTRLYGHPDKSRIAKARRGRREDDGRLYLRQMAAQCSAYRLSYDAVPAASLVLDHIEQTDWSAQSTGNVVTALAVALEGMLGIPYRDVCGFRFGRDGGRGALGTVCDGRVILQVGNGYFRDGDCFAPAEHEIALPPFLARLAEIACTRDDVGIRLDYAMGDISGPRKAFLERALRERPELLKMLGKAGLHTAFAAVAIDALGICPTVVGLLTARPLPGTRGECAYLRTDQEELDEALRRIWHRLRGQPDSHEGSPVLTRRPADPDTDPAQCYRELKDRVAGAKGWNQLMACAVAFFRLALGWRPLLDHPHPALHVRRHPSAAVELQDKEIAGTLRARWVALLPEVQAVIDALCRVLPASSQILYEHAGAWVGYSQLPDSARGALGTFLTFAHERNPRAALYGALRKIGVPNTVINTILGHGADPVQWNGHGNPVSLLRIIAGQRAALQRVYDRFGVGEIAGLLAEKIAALDPIKRSAGVPGPTLLGQAMEERHNGEIRLHVTPLTPIQHIAHDRLCDAFERAPHDKRLDVDFVIALALSGISPEHLLRQRAYYDQSCVGEAVGKDGSQHPCFAALVPHDDAGGLSALLLPLRPIPSGQGDAPLATRLLRRMVGRSRVYALTNPLITRPAKEFRRAVGTRVARLLCQTRDRCPLSHEAGFRLLAAIAENACVWHYGGSIAGVLSGAVPLGFNHADPRDVSERMFGTRDLRDIKGDPWRPRAAEPNGRGDDLSRFRNALAGLDPGLKTRLRIDSTRGRPPSLPTWCLRHRDPAEWTASQWAEVIAMFFPRPSVGRIRDAMRIAGLGKRAKTMSAAAYRVLAEKGRLRLSDAFSGRDLDWRDLGQAVAVAAGNRGLSAAEAEEMSAFVLWLYAGQCRPSEAYHLSAERLLMLPGSGDVYAGIPMGKTPAAKRVVSLAGMCPDRDLASHLLAAFERMAGNRDRANPSVFPLLTKRWGRPRRGRWVIDGRAMRPVLAAVLEEVADMKPYDLRHRGCMNRLTHVVGEHAANRYALATGGKGFGHQDAIQQWLHYVGTMIVAIVACPSTEMAATPDPAVACAARDAIWLGNEDVLTLVLEAGCLALPRRVANALDGLANQIRASQRPSRGMKGLILRVPARRGPRLRGAVTDVTLAPEAGPLQTLLVIDAMRAGATVAVRARAQVAWRVVRREAMRLGGAIRRQRRLPR